MPNLSLVKPEAERLICLYCASVCASGVGGREKGLRENYSQLKLLYGAKMKHCEVVIDIVA